MIISSTQANNIYTMAIASKRDKRQSIGMPYSIPDYDVRVLRAKVILEEALETIKALGLQLHQDSKGIHFQESGSPDLEKIIDGCCDTIYVATGTLVSCGVPDSPHLHEVCRANYDKFPDGKGIYREDGKYLKPEGWVPPNHEEVKRMMLTEGRHSLKEMTATVMDQAVSIWGHGQNKGQA